MVVVIVVGPVQLPGVGPVRRRLALRRGQQLALGHVFLHVEPHALRAHVADHLALMGIGTDPLRVSQVRVGLVVPGADGVRRPGGAPGGAAELGLERGPARAGADAELGGPPEVLGGLLALGGLTVFGDLNRWVEEAGRGQPPGRLPEVKHKPLLTIIVTVQPQLCHLPPTIHHNVILHADSHHGAASNGDGALAARALGCGTSVLVALGAGAGETAFCVGADSLGVAVIGPLGTLINIHSSRKIPRPARVGSGGHSVGSHAPPACLVVGSGAGDAQG
mmetsp:Transcript_106019/g.242743  ORF Transcript_106019/g.242743 Transcript_106019/m.242743 type:complete len:278 (+) Transcript_106019:3198-4031(+)